MPFPFRRNNRVEPQESGVKVDFYQPTKTDLRRIKKKEDFPQFVAINYKKDGVEPDIKTQNITPTKKANWHFSRYLTTVSGLNKLSFKIKKKEVIRIVNDLFDIMRNPQMVLHYLKDLDQELATKLQDKGIDLSDNSPQYFIAEKGRFGIGPAPKGYQPVSKGKILNEILLKREQENGVNLGGVAIFDDFVPFKDGNKFVGEGNIFSENEQKRNIVNHGKYSHRLAFEVLRQAAKEGKLDLSFGQGQTLTNQQLLELFVTLRLENLNIWGFVVDLADDRLFPISEPNRNPDSYRYSSTSPFIFKGLIAAFGENEIPTLRRYLLDSHYKQIAQMVFRVRELDQNRPEGKVLEEVPDDFIATQCEIFMDRGRVGGLTPTPFGNNEKDNLDKKYEPFGEGINPGIVRKKQDVAGGKNDAMIPKSDKEITVKKYDSLASYAKEKIDRTRSTPTR